MWAVKSVGEPMPKVTLCRPPGSLTGMGNRDANGEKTFQHDLVLMMNIHKSLR